MVYQVDEREVLESPKVQGADEARAYSFDFSAAGVTTIEGTPVITVYDWSTDPPLDVSSTTLSSGTPTATGTTVNTVKKLQSLTAGKEYRLYAKVTHDGGQTSELFCRIFGRL